MTGQELIELLGYSINDLKVKEAMKTFNLPKPKLFGYGSSMALNSKNGISLDFRPRVMFEREFLEPPHTLVPDFSIAISDLDPSSENMEFFIECVTFSKPFITDLPFGLKSDDTADAFLKLGKSHSKQTLPERYIWYFLSDKYRILTSLDKNKHLEFLRVWLIDNEIRKAQKRKETIKTQDKNIIPLLVGQIETLKSKKPTILWRKRMLDGDELFTNENIEQSDILLDSFLHSLQLATKEKKANKILTAIKAVVIAFNKLNDKYAHIDTQEREELCDFIDTLIKSTGFEINKNEDITYEWREW